MTQLLAIAMLLTLLAPQKQNLPDAFYELPEQVREQATLIVTGTYAEGRTPCIYLANGTRVWSMESLGKGEHAAFWDALDDEEIIAIVELK